MFCLIGNYPTHFKKGRIVKILFFFAYFSKSNSFLSSFLKWQLLKIQCLHVQHNSVSHSTPWIYSAIILLIIILSFSCIEGQSWTSRLFWFHCNCMYLSYKDSYHHCHAITMPRQLVIDCVVC